MDDSKFKFWLVTILVAISISILAQQGYIDPKAADTIIQHTLEAPAPQAVTEAPSEVTR